VLEVVKVVSQKDINKMAMTGVKVKKLTETSKPAPVVPDNSAQLSGIELRLAQNVARVSDVALVAATEQSKLQRGLEHLNGQIHSLQHELSTRRAPPQMQIQRGPQGFISAVLCGSLVFKFIRTQIGTVEKIDIITTRN